MKAKDLHPDYVSIEPLPVEEQPGVVIEMSEQSMEKKVKKQNVGTVLMKGNNVGDWLNPGDKVSFYRSASTPVTIEGKEIELVHHDHVLVIFETDESL